MNRIQFFVLTGLSSLVALLMIGHIFLVRQVGIDQAIFNQAQQEVNQGQALKGNLQQLALRIFQDSQKNPQDTELKNLLTRQQITFTPSTDSTNSTDTPAAPTTPSNH